MNLSDVIILGYILNVLVFVVALGLAVYIQKEIGLQLVRKIHNNASYKVKSWILFLYLVPYVPVLSVARSYYEYNKIKTDNLVESYERFINREPTWLQKLFMKDVKDTKDVGNSTNKI